MTNLRLEQAMSLRMTTTTETSTEMKIIKQTAAKMKRVKICLMILRGKKSV